MRYRVTLTLSMYSLFLVAVVAVAIAVVAVVACSPEPSATGELPYDPNMLGRWDGTVHLQGEETYPLWFELSRGENGADTVGGGVGAEVRGRLQPRFGHALDLEDIRAAGTHLTMRVDETTYAGDFDGAGFRGTGQGKGGESFEWTAARAPELPPPADPKWGPPIVLFDGKDLAGFKPRNPSEPNRWEAKDGALVNQDAGSDLVTEGRFWNFQLHIEVNVPQQSNSGIYLRGRYEVQVQDDFGKEPYNRGMGAIYGQLTPTENAALAPGEWQSFDITLLGRYVTVVLNDKTILNHQAIPGITGGALDSNEEEPGPIFLQGDHGQVSYRNITLRPVVQ